MLCVRAGLNRRKKQLWKDIKRNRRTDATAQSHAKPMQERNRRTDAKNNVQSAIAREPAGNMVYRMCICKIRMGCVRICVLDSHGMCTNVYVKTVRRTYEYVGKIRVECVRIYV